MSTPVNKKRLLPSTPKEQTIRSPRVPKSITKQPLREQKPKNGTPNTTSESSSRKLKRNFNIPPANKSLKNMNTTPVSSGLKAKNPETPKKRPLNLIDEARLEDSFSSINLLEKKNKSLKQRASILMDGKSYEPSYENSSIKVAVRVRPFSEREVKSSTDVLNSVITMSGNITKVTNPSGKDHEFVYDHSFWSIDADNPHSPYVTQEDVYRTVAKPLLHYSLEGYNTCLFAYGQTGSGKSYTVMGYESDNELGIIPRFSKDLFIEIEYLKNQHKAQYSVEISYYEIYNEKIFDLLSVNEARQQQQRLCVRENPDSGPYVQGLSTNIVGNHKDIQDWLEVGNKNRATASTGMNDKSSRSHSVFTIILTQVTTEEFEGTETQLQKTSKINLIDLAGSERAKKVLDDKVIQGSPQVMETRLKEGGCINKSLHTLGKVISMLSEMELKNKKKGQYIPYRDSVLTWLLKESLGGNAKTTMIATISPSTLHYSETLSTLRYAQQARSIVNNAKVNEDPKSKLIREMLAEIQRLKNSQERTGDTGKALEKEVMVLRKNLNDTRSALATSTRSWQEKLASSEKKQKEAASHLRRSGVAFTKLEKHLPSLVNLNEDPQLAEVLLYILQEGVTNIGQQEPLNDNDIQLKSHMIADRHCIITYSQETVILSPAGDSPTYVNGCLINEQTTLHHGDRLVIGGDHFFRLNHPKEALKLKDQNSSENDKTNKGFEFAKQEFIEKQNKRLEDELEEARLKAEEEAMEQIKNAQIKAEEEMKSQRSFFQQQMDELQKKLTDSTCKQKQAEDGQQNAQEIISQLKEQQKVLEDEILSNRKRLQTEALAARQILEETRSKQSQLIGSLESEKQKMQDDLNQLKDAKANRDKMRSSIHLTVNNQEQSKDDPKDLLKISLMTREANQISQCMKQPYSFDRVDLCRDGKVDIRIRITNKVTCKSTFINIDRFEEELSTMKDLSQNQNLINEKNFKWTKEESGNRKRTRFSFGGKPMDQSDSFISNFNQSFEQMKRRTLENSRLADESCSRLQMIDDSSQLLTPAESTRLSSVNQSSTAFQSDLSISRTSFFETILEIDTQNSQGASSIIASLINLIISIYKDWKLVLSQDGGSTSMMSGVGERTQLSDMDGPVVRMACNLKCLKDQASILCAVHEAVGLEDLKRISQAFREDIFETCSFVKKYILQREDSTELIKKQFKHLIYQLIELTGALSLSAVDHLDETNDEISYIDNDDENDIFIHFLKQQNRFLSSMMDEALNTVVKGVQNIKHLQLTQTHEMSEDLVDGVMNILTSTTTLIRRCKDLMMVYADINISETTVFYVKECFILRKFLTSVVDYNESVINIVEQSRQIASNCDAIEDFMDIPVELADTTKCICKAGRDLVAFLSTKKNLDQETLSLLRSCIEKFEFAGKTVRVGVAIVVQEIEKDLEIHEEHSILSFVQSEVSLQRTASMCPLNRTSLDMSAIHPQVQEKFKGRRSDVRPDMFISRYMDTTTESYNETRE